MLLSRKNCTHARSIPLFAVLVFVIAGGIVGCGGKYPSSVSGQVLIDGQAPPDRERVRTVITYFPIAGGAAAYGNSVSGGQYHLRTGSERGLAPGDYKVTVEITELNPPPPGGYINAPGFRFISPRVYATRETTPLSATVSEGANQIDLKLDSSLNTQN